MAHECPECYCVCYCNGDIDDLVLNYERDIARCNCCEDDGDIMDLYDEDEYEVDAMDSESSSASEAKPGEAQAEPEQSPLPGDPSL